MRSLALPVAIGKHLVERKFKKIAGVRKVNARHATGKTEIVHSGDLDPAPLRNAIADDGYTVSPWPEQKGGAPSADANTGRGHFETGAAFLILVGLFGVLWRPCRARVWRRSFAEIAAVRTTARARHTRPGRTASRARSRCARTNRAGRAPRRGAPGPCATAGIA